MLYLWLTTLVGLLALVMPQSSLAASEDAAKALFKSYKCVKCHKIEALGFSVLQKDEDDDDDDDDEEDGEAPDLSKLSEKVTKVGDVEKQREHLKLFLKKKVRHGTKKHKKRFKGPDEDFEAIIGALLSLDEAASAKEAPAKAE